APSTAATGSPPSTAPMPASSTTSAPGPASSPRSTSPRPGCSPSPWRPRADRTGTGEGRSARLLVEGGEGDGREQRGLVQVVVREAGQDGEGVTALWPALAHPAAVAKAAVEQGE